MNEADVVVVGSGASGLTAALIAADAGLSVTVVEKAGVFGGTSVVSGGSIWAPCNRWLADLGRTDSREDALAYLKTITMGRVEEDRYTVFVDTVNPMLDEVVALTGISFEANPHHPDYQPDMAGAMSGGGRTLQGDLFDTTLLGDLKPKLRQAHSSVPITRLEVDEWGQDTLDRWDWALIADRVGKGIVGMGAALVGALLHGCQRKGVTLHTDTPARRLIRGADGSVAGVVVEHEGVEQELRARRGVILASGGFEWNKTLVDQFLGAPLTAPSSPPHNTGDGLLMAMGAGAMLGNMNQAWWSPSIYVMGDSYDNAPLYRPTSSLRALPGGIIVNRSGRRFVDEAMNYNDMGKALANFDPQAYAYANQPCWLIFDQRFRDSYSVATVTPETPAPAWFTVADSYEELADKLGIDKDGFLDQMKRYNDYAATGVDIEFHRGESTYDSYRGDARVTPHRNLRPLEDGPYYAVEVLLGALGTNGGPQTDTTGNVLAADGGTIKGLYAAGNVAASPFGPGYPGAGATLAAGMTYGYLSAKALAG
ncbi:FAD-dependent oxidoreductase [Microbispora bryophytorum]|uniref:FAD-binding protein n=1 Tax=Microbispora bryophytorum TaxID=1460882 RepID=A0A8H9H4Y2_9ACTN|nr:FAD-dependent oxidoreductase [Microbispora bryophytorum]MBD3136478.1 FAD-dependent oxidoreductase [Microbispora bryophytorum]GGO18783.1 FAD-binding protein [Microbispora bryophytorum]